MYLADNEADSFDSSNHETSPASDRLCSSVVKGTVNEYGVAALFFSNIFEF